MKVEQHQAKHRFCPMVTDWDMPKGEYHVDQNGHLVAYQAPEAELKVFSAPMKQFSKSRRKFKKVGEYAK